MSRILPASLTIAILLVSVHSRQALGAELWPQFRGPDGQGHASVTALPVEWSEGKNIAWKTELPGQGWSSPVVWSDQIWMTTATDEGHQLHALCVDLTSGRLLHDVVVFQIAEPVRLNAKNSYASPTPVIEQGRLYVHFGTMGTACVDTNMAQVIWRQNDLHVDHKEGPGSSPIPFDEFLIVHYDGMDAQFVVALNKSDGAVAWLTERTGSNAPDPDLRKAYGTPLVVEVDGRPQLISPAADRTSAYDPYTGQELWWVDYKGFSNVPRPITDGNMVYICTGFTKPELWALRPGGKGDVTDSRVLWKYRQQVPQNPSPLLVDGAIYMVSDRGVASCVDAHDGALLWKDRLGGNYSASPLYGAGRIYFFSEQGVSTVVAPNREGLETLAVNELQGRIMATPAALEGCLILRTDTHLYRIQANSDTARAAR